MLFTISLVAVYTFDNLLLISGHFGTGSRYNELNPVICVNILDFILFQDLKNAHSCFLATEKNETDYVLTDDFQIHFLELPKIKLDKKKLKNRLEKWAYFFTKEGLITEEVSSETRSCEKELDFKRSA